MIQDLKVTTILVKLLFFFFFQILYYFIILDGEEFYDPQYNRINYTGSQDPRFIKKREILREFLKTKDKRHTRSIGQKMFSRKLGGTHNNQKPHKNHKSNNGKSNNKFRGKNVKPAVVT